MLKSFLICGIWQVLDNSILRENDAKRLLPLLLCMLCIIIFQASHCDFDTNNLCFKKVTSAQFGMTFPRGLKLPVRKDMCISYHQTKSVKSDGYLSKQFLTLSCSKLVHNSHLMFRSSDVISNYQNLKDTFYLRILAPGRQDSRT